MKAQEVKSENSAVPVQGHRKKSGKTGASQDTSGDAAPAHMSSPPNPQPLPSDSTRIPLDQIVIDGTIFPRASLDKYIIKQYAAALIRGEHLPPITIEEIGQAAYRVLKGVHRLEAYRLRRYVYTGKRSGDFYDEPLPRISET